MRSFFRSHYYFSKTNLGESKSLVHTLVNLKNLENKVAQQLQNLDRVKRIKFVKNQRLIASQRDRIFITQEVHSRKLL